MSGDQQLAERPQQLRHILEVQPRGRLIEQEQLAAMRGAREHRAGVRQVPGELQALRLTAGERGHGLPEFQILQSHIRQRTQAQRDLGRIRKECAGLRSR